MHTCQFKRKNAFCETQSKHVTSGNSASVCFFFVHRSSVRAYSSSTKFLRHGTFTSFFTTAATGTRISTNKPANACLMSLSFTKKKKSLKHNNQLEHDGKVYLPESSLRALAWKWTTPRILQLAPFLCGTISCLTPKQIREKSITGRKVTKSLPISKLIMLCVTSGDGSRLRKSFNSFMNRLRTEWKRA